jgi:2-methylisocitrate lyase-like PEP mutase family enzyme
VSASPTDGRASPGTSGGRLRELLDRDGEVLPVLGIPSARYAKIMQATGTSAGFVGTSITFGNYTGLPDTGVASAPECVAIGGHVARAVDFPVMIDGDTGHGGKGAVGRLVEMAIREGLAGLRLDDQPLETKQRTEKAGILVADFDAAVERYRWAVEARDATDPSFVIMAQCYARDAVNGGFDELLKRLAAYESQGGVDWVQFEAPHSTEEIGAAREVVKGYFSAMKGRLPRALTIAEHAALKLDAAWYNFVPSRVLLAECLRFMRAFENQGVDAWNQYEAANRELLAETSNYL